MAAYAPVESLRNLQINAISKMLNFNMTSADPTAIFNPDADMWKIFIYDGFSKEIIAPILQVGQLRDMGVTLNLDLHSEREPVPDVPAVYLCAPTTVNVERIVRDCAARMYSRAYVNFTSASTPELLTTFARLIAEAGAADVVASVYDQFLNYVCLEKFLFELHHKNSYYSVNAALSESEIMGYIDTVVDGLFSAVVVSGVLPFIRCPRQDSAEMVARALAKRLHDHYMSADNTFLDKHSPRPILIILDRNTDVPVVLHHAWTYQAQVHDVLGLKSNRVQLPGKDGALKNYDLSCEEPFWATNAGAPFTQIASAVEEITKEHAELVNRVARMQESLKADEASHDRMALLNDTRQIAEKVPEQTEKKRVLDMHMHIATSLAKMIEQRSLNDYFFLEEDILMGNSANLDMDELVSLLTNSGTPEDKLRLYLMYYWANPSMTQEQQLELETILNAKGVDLRAAQHLRRIRAFKSLRSATAHANASSGAAASWKSFIGKGMQVLDNVGLKNWLPSNKDSTIVKIVRAAMEGTSGDTELDSYLYVDPRVSANPVAAPGENNKPVFKDATVFMVGGGNYVEYHFLQQYCKDSLVTRRVTYGCTELLAPVEMLRQLSLLATDKK